MELVILADDFTGAGDAAAAFAGSRGVFVVLSAEGSRPHWDSGVDVLAVDLDARECAASLAEQKAEDVARKLCASSPEARVFLKIDSTLRGPIAGLVAGALTGSGKDIAVIAPAFPEQGRFLRAGRVVVNGEPGASLTGLLGMQATALLGAKYTGSAEEVERAVEHARLLGTRRVVVDADSSECLQRLAVAWQHHADWLLVGSGGLSRQVALAAQEPGTTESPGGPDVPRYGDDLTPATGPILVVAGSPTAVTAAQIDRLRGIGAVITIQTTSLEPARLPPPPHRLLVLCTPRTTERDTGQSADAIAEVVLEWSRSLLPAVVVVAGGATARRLCERLGVVGVRLSGELSPGVPVGRLVGGRWNDVLVVTKAGGFGDPTTLLDVVRSVGVSSSSP